MTNYEFQHPYKLSLKQTLDVFKETKNISIELSNKDVIRMYKCKGSEFRYNHCDLFSLEYLKFIKRDPRIPDDEDYYSYVIRHPVNPLNEKKALLTFLRLYKNTLSNTITKLPILTEEDIDYIVTEQNKPI